MAVAHQSSAPNKILGRPGRDSPRRHEVSGRLMGVTDHGASCEKYSGAG